MRETSVLQVIQSNMGLSNETVDKLVHSYSHDSFNGNEADRVWEYEMPKWTEEDEIHKFDNAILMSRQKKDFTL